MGKGGAAPTNALQSDDNARLTKENSVLKIKNVELNKVVGQAPAAKHTTPCVSEARYHGCDAFGPDFSRGPQLMAEKDAQKETLRERHLSVRRENHCQ